MSHGASMLIAGVEYVTAQQGAAQLDVDVNVIYQWRRRGLVTEVARVRGRPIYLLGDLWEVERDTRNRTRPRSSTASSPGDVRLHASSTPVSNARTRT